MDMDPYIPEAFDQRLERLQRYAPPELAPLRVRTLACTGSLEELIFAENLEARTVAAAASFLSGDDDSGGTTLDDFKRSAKRFGPKGECALRYLTRYSAKQCINGEDAGSSSFFGVRRGDAPEQPPA